MRVATRDHCSGSGLTANRINLLNASGLYPAFDSGSCSPRPALCYRPSPTLLLSFLRTQKVILARAPDAAPTGKTGNVSKNDYLFTPSRKRVNQKACDISRAISMACSPSTRPCHEYGALAGVVSSEIRARQRISGLLRMRSPIFSSKSRPISMWKSRENIARSGFCLSQ